MASGGGVMKRMLWIGVVSFAASAVLFASPSGAPSVRWIVESSTAATQHHWQARLLYTYMERAVNRRLDMDGRVKSEDVEITRTIPVNDVPFDQLVERNGQPPSAREERRQNEALDALRRQTPAQRTERLRQRDEEATSLVQEVPKAFDFQLTGREMLNGRAAYVLRATPNPVYQARGQYGKLFAKVEGKVWIDIEDLVWIKVEGQVTQQFSIGLFLVRLLRGSQVTIEQTRVDDGIWMLSRVDVRAAATILLVKSLLIERVLTYSGYRRAGADTASVRD
jgi:hypothetical protein